MITTLLRFTVLSAITFTAAFLILLVAGRLAVALGWAETHSVLSVLRVAGGISLGSACLGLVLWHRDV